MSILNALKGLDEDEGLETVLICHCHGRGKADASAHFRDYVRNKQPAIEEKFIGSFSPKSDHLSQPELLREARAYYRRFLKPKVPLVRHGVDFQPLARCPCYCF